MAESIRPDATKTFGRRNMYLLDAVAGYATGVGPTVAEMTAASTIEVTRILTSGSGTPTQATERARQELRWGDTSAPEFLAETNHTGGELVYALATQGAVGSDGRKLYEAIPEGSVKFLTRRLGVKRAVDVIGGQTVTYWPIEIGPTIDDESNPGQNNAEAVGRCSYAVIGDPVILKPIRTAA